MPSNSSTVITMASMSFLRRVCVLTFVGFVIAEPITVSLQSKKAAPIRTRGNARRRDITPAEVPLTDWVQRTTDIQVNFIVSISSHDKKLISLVVRTHLGWNSSPELVSRDFLSLTTESRLTLSSKHCYLRHWFSIPHSPGHQLHRQLWKCQSL